MNKELQEKLEKKQIEFNKIKIQMEMQKKRFNKIISVSQNYLRSTKPNQTELQKNNKIDSNEQINHLHQQIQLNISNIQKKTYKTLIQRELDIIRFFNKRIDLAKKKFKKEIMNNGQKDQKYIQKEKQLLQQLNWIKNIAQKQKTQNHNLIKKYMELISQYQIQENDRQMLFKQLIMKIKNNAILKSQLEQYQKLLQQCSIQIKEKQEQINYNKSFYNNKSIINEDRQQNIIQILKGTIQKKQKKYHVLQNLYVKEIQIKTQLQKKLGMQLMIQRMKQQKLEVNNV